MNMYDETLLRNKLMAANERAEKAERERDELGHDRIKAWENGYLNGRDDALSEFADQENALRAKHWREAAEWLNKEDGFACWGTYERANDKADAIERGEQ